MFAKIRLRRDLTHWVSYRRGQAFRRYRCPWWSNRMIYAIAYSRGRKHVGELSCGFSAWTSWAVAIAICGALIIAMSWRLSNIWWR
jgi:hypothetical protein